jgi:hypothetical protein
MKLARTFILLAACAAAGCDKNEAPTAPAACGYTLSSAAQSAPAGGGTFAVSVTKTSGSCTWSASSNATWLTFSGTPSGSDTGTLTYIAQANSDTASRTGTITVQWSGGSAQVTVTQAGTPTQTSACTYAVASASLSAPAEGAALSVAVTTTGTGCTWSASADVPWLTPTSGGSGTGAGTVAYAAAANPDPSTRTGTITVQGASGNAKVVVTQSGVSCVYTLSPLTQDVTSSGGSFTLAAVRNTANGCSWSATTSTPWIALTGATSGISPAAIAYSVAANTGAARIGEITVAWSGGSTQLVVRQAAPPTPVFNVSFALFDPGRQSAPSSECQIASVTSTPTTCTLVATANLPTAIVSYDWTIQYPYGFQRTLVQNNASPTFTFTESCGQSSASNAGTAATLSVQLIVTDAVGNTATVRSGSGSQPALQITFFTCGIR